MSERVHTGSCFGVPGYGSADFDGKVHHYEDISAPGGRSVFRLTPISKTTFQQDLERWEIYKRWEAEYVSGEGYLEDQPALPHEQERYEELEWLVRQAVKDSADQSFKVEGVFIECDEDYWTVTWNKTSLSQS